MTRGRPWLSASPHQGAQSFATQDTDHAAADEQVPPSSFLLGNPKLNQLPILRLGAPGVCPPPSSTWSRRWSFRTVAPLLTPPRGWRHSRGSGLALRSNKGRLSFSVEIAVSVQMHLNRAGGILFRRQSCENIAPSGACARRVPDSPWDHSILNSRGAAIPTAVAA